MTSKVVPRRFQYLFLPLVSSVSALTLVFIIYQLKMIFVILSPTDAYLYDLSGDLPIFP